ncbi:hypothetical protein RY831_09975 [Noviherbaspirillum sp. CPCC 100848]|uniref:Molecular chaperone DnaJ n=1 Tax=Noviherbaspirillum album TaxID=3080276 RepID=A0ABU6J757_9BURK|nr:hypothetical protein [Noviherbaspirillum sp. CPCC 100848]MEC4719479.1 hypothetical protein [Noviherbaspirillum sp. CPCC 100848]
MSTSTSGSGPTGTPGTTPNHLKPGDEAMAGTPGTGEDLCPDCSGKGKKADGAECPTCEGTGRITQGIGGG